MRLQLENWCQTSWRQFSTRPASQNAAVSHLWCCLLAFHARYLLLLACLLLFASFAHADGRAATWLEIYDDDDNLRVLSSQLAVRAEALPDVELSASYEVDVISAATTDVVSAASPRGYEENRHGLSFGASWELEAGTSVLFRYLPSWEVDYRSQGFIAGISREWIDRRLTTSIQARLSLDEVGRSGSGESSFHDVNTVALNLGLGWILTRHTILQATYEPQRSKGAMESPYRFVDILWSDGTIISAPEALPETRIRHAMSLGARHALDETWFLSGTYRLYLDSWGIVSHTAETELQHALDWDKLIIGVGMRGYRQGDADFHKTSYSSMTGVLPGLRSSDKMLTQSWSLLGGARAELAIGKLGFLESLRLALKFEVYDQHFQNFPNLKRRLAKIAAFGASSEF